MAEEKPHYLMISKKLIITWLITTGTLFAGVIGSYQYINYVSQQLCGLISISVDTYEKTPPPTETGKALQKEFNRISNKYHCA